MGTDILNTVNHILYEGDDYESLVNFRWEGYVWDELIMVANEMIHRSRLILRKWDMN